MILAVGCVTPTREKPTLDMVREQNASNLLKINIGMDKKEVLEIMGTETIQTCFYSTQMLEAQLIPNPYRTETIETTRNGNKAFGELSLITPTTQIG